MRLNGDWIILAPVPDDIFGIVPELRGIGLRHLYRRSVLAPSKYLSEGCGFAGAVDDERYVLPDVTVGVGFFRPRRRYAVEAGPGRDATIGPKRRSTSHVIVEPITRSRCPDRRVIKPPGDGNIVDVREIFPLDTATILDARARSRGRRRRRGAAGNAFVGPGRPRPILSTRSPGAYERAAVQSGAL